MIALAAAAILAVGIAALAPRLGGSDPKEALAAAGCVAKAVPDQGAAHLQDLNQNVEYNSFPPTSGRHYQTPAIFNYYSDPIDQKLVVHNLEHGGVAIQYGDKVPADVVGQLEAYWRDDPNGLLVAPLPALGNQIALTAWTQLALCPSFDEDAADTFVAAYRFKGPERLPPEALAPGM